MINVRIYIHTLILISYYCSDLYISSNTIDNIFKFDNNDSEFGNSGSLLIIKYTNKMKAAA